MPLVMSDALFVGTEDISRSLLSWSACRNTVSWLSSDGFYYHMRIIMDERPILPHPDYTRDGDRTSHLSLDSGADVELSKCI